MKQTRHFFLLALVVCVMVAVFSVTALATENEAAPVAQIGTTSYMSLDGADGAIAKVEAGQTITLLKDVTLADDTPLKIVDKGTAENPITLNLNGRTISGSNSKNGTTETTTTPGGILWIYGSYVTLTDTSTSVEKGGIVNTSEGSSTSSYSYGLVVKSTTENVGAVTIKGGVHIDVTKSMGNNARAIYFQNDTNTSGTLTLTIENAKVTANKGLTVYASAGSGYSCMATINGGEFKSTGKTNTTENFSGSSSTMTINGGTFYNWSNTAWNEVAQDHVICIAQPTNSDSFTVTIAAQVPNDYVALVDSTDVYREICLTEGSNLYAIHNIQTPAGTNGSGRTIHVKKDVSYIFPDGKYYGYASSNDPGNYRLTLDLAEGVTLSGGMNLYSADITVTGEGALSSDFTWAPADGFEMTANGETNGLYSCRLTTGGGAELIKADGTSIVYKNIVSAIAAAKLNPGSTAKMLANYTNSAYVDVSVYNTVVADFTLDLNGYTYTYSGSSDAITVNSGAKLTVTDSSETGGGAIVTKGARDTMIANSALATTGTGGTIIIEEGVTVKNLVLLDAAGSKLTVAGTVDTTGFNNYAISGNGSTGKGNTEITIKETAVIKSDAEKAAAPAIYHPQSGTLTVEGGTISGYGGIQMCSGDLIITGNPKITATGSDDTANKTDDGGIPDGAAISVVDRSYPGGAPTVTITGTPEVSAANGDAVQAYTWSNNTKSDWNEANTYVKISGGYYTSDVTKYCVEGKMAVDNQDGNHDTYAYKVGEIETIDIEVEEANMIGSAVGTTGSAIESENVEAAKTVAESVTATEIAFSLTDAEKTKESSTALVQLKANGIIEIDEDHLIKDSEGNNATVTVVREVYFEVETVKYAVADNEKSITLDIEPKYNLIATIETISNETSSEDLSDEKTVVIAAGKSMTITEPVELSVTLPNDFADSETKIAYVQHKGHEYTAKIENNVATFTNPDGFSEFTITLESKAVASIGTDSYTTLQDAVDAVQDGQTITVLQDGASANVSRAVKFSVKKNTNSTSYTINVQGNYKNQSNTVDEYDIVSTDSSGGIGSSNYLVNVPDVDNGTVAVSPKYAVGGSMVTITVTPDEGYELDTLTVTDAKGNELALTSLGDGKYSFKMPYSKVTVNATFVETDPEPVLDPIKDCPKDETCPAAKFEDVKLNEWYHDGIHYCIVEGLMNGTSATTFEPDSATDRAMLVTVLYRLEGQPKAGECPFTDVRAGEWYTDAITWAAENKIVEGYGDGTFGPEDSITREQFATILYRYAKYKGYDVTAKADITTFVDGSDTETWAEDAMAWAVAEKLINGIENNQLDPQGDAIRAQMATILYRFCENVAK